MEYQIKELLQISQTLGVLKFVNQKQIKNFKLAFQPYHSTEQVYQMLGQYQLLWHKLFFKISEDKLFIEQLFYSIAERDEMVKRLYSIFKKLKESNKKDGIVFSRCDYYFNQKEEPKLTQYNLMSVGMQSHMEKFQEAKKLTDYSNRQLYADCYTVQKFVEAIDFYSRIKESKGIILFVVLPVQSNLFDQIRFEIQLIKKGFKVRRATYSQLHDKIFVNQNKDLYFEKQLVSIVYYRSGYIMNQFSVKGDIQLGWKIKESMQLSNAVSIPSVTFQLINQKRVQTQLKKPEVLRRFLNEQQALRLEKTFVQELQFQTMKDEDYEILLSQIQANSERYILKPNLQGGNNNFFGKQALQKLRTMSRKQAQIYILMEKIISKSHANKIMNGSSVEQINCSYEISRYGAFCWVDGKIEKNVAAGFLIRAKPQQENEGGIMSGVGAIVPWKFKQQ